jgi:hypothetical protein
VGGRPSVWFGRRLQGARERETGGKEREPFSRARRRKQNKPFCIRIQSRSRGIRILRVTSSIVTSSIVQSMSTHWVYTNTTSPLPLETNSHIRSIIFV